MSVSVLFVGDDASSPQIAASLLTHLAGDRVTVTTARTQSADPGGRSDEMLVAMGLDPADDRRLSARALRTADRVIVLGTALDVARVAGPRYEVWELVEGDLLDRVQVLSEELTRRPATAPRATVANRLRSLVRAAQR